jgi:hypothetical protein
MPHSTEHKELEQQIRDFRKLSALQKLQVLEEMQRFLEIATPAKAKRIRDKLRGG